MTFDSGLGGLSVLDPLVEAFPFADHVYVADDLGFPYGERGERDLIDHCISTFDRLIKAHNPTLIVIACNTISTLILQTLRRKFDLPIVGTVPAIKPAATVTKSGMVSVLATPGTVKRDYTRALMDTYASHCDVMLVGSSNLASLAEVYMRDGAVDLVAVREEIEACFVERQQKRTDVIVLGCTHYPLLLPVFEKVAPWPVTFLDPAEAVAKRVENLLPSQYQGDGRRQFITTSGIEFALSADQLSRFG